MQWNIQKTKGSDGLCNPDRITNTIVAQNVDIVSLNEVNFFSGVCAWTFDMGERLQSLMQQKTGMTWYRQSVNVAGGTSGYGDVLLSRYPPVSSSTTLLDYTRGVAQMGIVVNGRTVNVFSTHMEWDVAWWRPIQITEAVNWVANFSEPMEIIIRPTITYLIPMQEPARRIHTDGRDWPAEAARLYTLLIAPAARQLAGKTRLIVEPVPLFDRAVSAALDSIAARKAPAGAAAAA